MLFSRFQKLVVCVALVGLWLPTSVIAQGFGGGLISGGKAFLPLPSKPIALPKGFVNRVEWCDEGRFLLVHAVDLQLTGALLNQMVSGNLSSRPEMTISDYVYDCDTGKLVKAVTWDPNKERVDSVKFWPSTRSVTYLVTRNSAPEAPPYAEFVSIVLGSSTPRRIPLETFDLRPDAMIVEGKSTLLVTDGIGGRAVLLDAQGSLLDSFPYPKFGRSGFGTISFIFGTNDLAFFYVEDQKQKVVQILKGGKPGGAIDPATLTLHYEAGPSNPHYELEERSKDQVIGGKSMEFWLVATKEPELKEDPVECLVTSDADQALLSSDGDRIAYVHRGVALTCEIVGVDAKLAREAQAAAKRAMALSNAKQAGLALMMFSTDNDDLLPANDEQWRDKVNPYIKNMDLLAGFVYTFPGGNLADIKDPANTELGHVNGPGGRAVVYADGHAKWIPDPK